MSTDRYAYRYRPANAVRPGDRVQSRSGRQGLVVSVTDDQAWHVTLVILVDDELVTGRFPITDPVLVV